MDENPVNENPIIEQVAARMWAIDRQTEGFADLHPEHKAYWYEKARYVTEPMLTAAIDGYARGGVLCDPDVFDEETQETAGKVAATFRRWRTAWRSSTDEHIEFPIYAVNTGLAAFAALRAAFGWTPTRTAPEITDSMRDHEKQTPAGDELRLHLADAHAYPVALGAGDGEADEIHREMHDRGEAQYAHPVTAREWSADGARYAITAKGREGFPEDPFLRPLGEHLDRAPMTADFDHLRLHLMARHCLVNAAQLRDHEAIDAHEHEHDGPGTIRDHPRGNVDWHLDAVYAKLADLAHEPELKDQYGNAINAALDRLAKRAEGQQ